MYNSILQIDDVKICYKKFPSTHFTVRGDDTESVEGRPKLSSTLQPKLSSVRAREPSKTAEPAQRKKINEATDNKIERCARK